MTDDFQKRASKVGEEFHQTAKFMLKANRWEILSEKWTHPEVGVSIDFIAVSPESGVTWYIDAKGSYDGVRPGCIRTDTLYKAIAVAVCLTQASDRKPVMLLTSHLPKSGSAGDKALDSIKGICIDAVWSLSSEVEYCPRKPLNIEVDDA